MPSAVAEPDRARKGKESGLTLVCESQTNESSLDSQSEEPIYLELDFGDRIYIKPLEYGTFSRWTAIEGLMMDLERDGMVIQELWDGIEKMRVCSGDWDARVRPGWNLEMPCRNEEACLQKDRTEDGSDGEDTDDDEDRWIDEVLDQNSTQTMNDMAARIANLRSILPDLESALTTFTHSSSKFRVVRTVNPTNTQPKTLYILDSSFNPPSIAHLSLVQSALKNHGQSEHSPYRLLLLFSTQNADKAPSPASFVQRIALMTIFAEDFSRSLKMGSAGTELSDLSIDIGLTKEPYYSDKSIAIRDTSPPFYSSEPIHVHLIGYDTLIRFCNPKYYPKYDPPLSALKPFFDDGHKLRVTQRPTDPNDKSSNEFGTVEAQQKYVNDLKNGTREKDGFRPEWADNIDMVEANDSVGVSSTRVRGAAKDGNWDLVEELCTEGVAAWLRDQALYSEDASGKKLSS
ncbi:hypothetical protein E8E12_005286 [Didymella heteroderae]|uniref:Nicotinamide-nucleotide adenylyltransferase n=1 Tax=Didymella heteroderae TaxID=1769908 RepID=A0A9P5C0U4_9PLEO|nr:hypothetical protein E8E12_005286 [Didymella heteroderae]